MLTTIDIYTYIYIISFLAESN